VKSIVSKRGITQHYIWTTFKRIQIHLRSTLKLFENTKTRCDIVTHCFCWRHNFEH